MCKMNEDQQGNEHMAVLRSEIAEFLLHCQKTNIDFEKVYQKAQSQLTGEEKHSPRSPKGLRIAKRPVHFCILATFLAILLYLRWEQFSTHSIAISRILMIQTLPFYDWRPLKNERCLIKTSTSTSSPKVENFVDCTYCEAINTIPTLTFNNFNEDEDADVIKSYYDIDAPVLINNPQSKAQTSSTFIDSLLELEPSDDYAAFEPCDIASNVHIKRFANIREIFTHIKTAPFYFLHYRNCHYGAKLFRRHFPRPRLMHIDFSPVQQSWLMASSDNYKGHAKRLPLLDRVRVLAQVAGGFKVTLSPLVECLQAFQCKFVEVFMSQGDVLLFSDLWSVEYQPVGNESLAVVLEAH